MCSKIIERPPLRYSIVRAISCFDPEVLLNQPEIARKRNELLCKIFVKANRLTHADSDKIKSQFDKLVTLIGSKLKPDFEAFHPDPSLNIEQKKFRLDALYSFIFCPANFPTGYKELYRLLQLALTFSQGNSPVEMVFSINENMLEENMEKESIVNRRLQIFFLRLIS